MFGTSMICLEYIPPVISVVGKGAQRPVLCLFVKSISLPYLYVR